MNKEAIVMEMNGHMAKLIENYQRKDQVSAQIKESEIELKKIELAIQEAKGVLQTLQFLLATDGFTNIPNQLPNKRDMESSNIVENKES